MSLFTALEPPGGLWIGARQGEVEVLISGKNYVEVSSLQRSIRNFKEALKLYSALT